MNGMETYLGGSPLIAVGAAFAGGLLAGLSPCIYPMLPIVSAYVGSRTSGERTRLSSFLLSLAYVVGMATVYSLLGMVAALSGSMFGRISSSPWALLVAANILILFALNILEVIPFPTWFAGRTRVPAAEGLSGAFLLGASSGLVASPCTTPVLFGLLTFVATSHSVVYGAVLLFAFSMGMGVLLIVVGTCSGLAATLPKPGRWMVAVKTVLGLLLLGLAEYYLIRAGQVWF
ncbi:MAG: sulfite exporter TauE/SafE family protein [Verrucomicrobia bacterium]|nr:sulfite exporter TauE/SafE family protein [Deltaproteobacteria bacterium]